MSDQNEKDGPINFYGDSSSSDERDEKQQLRDADEKILSLARQYTNQSTQNIESASLRNVPVGETASIASDGLGRRLSRTVTNMLSHIDTNINPFIEPTDPILDPYSDQFNARAWARHVLRFKDRDPERYPMRTTGVSFRNLGAFGYGTGTDYQKTVANLPLQVPSVIRSFFGHKGDKVQILREFDGLVRSGESCVVLGRPGR